MSGVFKGARLDRTAAQPGRTAVFARRQAAPENGTSRGSSRIRRRERGAGAFAQGAAAAFRNRSRGRPAGRSRLPDSAGIVTIAVRIDLRHAEDAGSVWRKKLEINGWDSSPAGGEKSSTASTF